jgi:hypothetical protein
VIPVEVTQTPWHYTTFWDWVDHWQTIIAGGLALLAAWLTIRETKRSAGREIEASQAQTAVAQKEIDRTVRLEQERVLNEDRAFRAMLEAATGVLAEAAWAKKTYPESLALTEGLTVEALGVRQCITKGAFAELRAACIRLGSPLTAEFLALEREIDNFALQWEDHISHGRVLVRRGKHAGLREQLEAIEDKASTLRDLAAHPGFSLTRPSRAEHAGSS